MAEKITKKTDKTLESLLEGKDVSALKRVFFRNFKESYSLPSLNEIQLNSFSDFLQIGVEKEKRLNVGLQSLFLSTFPFESSDGKVRLEFVEYALGERVLATEEAIRKDRSYTMPIRATIRLILKETGEIKEQEIFICDIPFITEHGTFIINGTERVVVSQIHRSPGVVFDYGVRTGMYHSRIIPNKGPWLEFEILREVLYVRIDRKARLLISTFMRALGFVRSKDLIELFFKSETLQIVEGAQLSKEDETEDEKEKRLAAIKSFVEDHGERRLFDDVVVDVGGKKTLVARAGDKLNSEIVETFLKQGLREISVVDSKTEEEYAVILNAIDKDTPEMTQEEACKYIYFLIRGSQPASTMVAVREILPCYKQLDGGEKKPREVVGRMELESVDGVNVPVYAFKEADGTEIEVQDEKIWERSDSSCFFNESRYSLGDVGRFKINRKFNIQAEELVLTMKDIVETIRHLVRVKNSEFQTDDIDHLGNRRIRCVGEQLVNHLKLCFVRMERLARDRITIQNHNTLTPQTLISIKPITAGINEFFGTSQLSQFMDQTNPLAAVTHKRRLSALGPGGLTRERAGFEVRDVHYTHYGRMCPIETPEGPNIGLIVSLASYARINPFGFIETPYFKVKEGVITDEVHFLSAIEEERYVIAPASVPRNADGGFRDEMVPVRFRGNYPMRYSKDVDYIDVSSHQIVSLSAALIPFLEHDDANRALMGCNMMRQAVPLLVSEAPVVGTGLEESVARDSGFCQIAKREGVVTRVANDLVEVTTKSKEVDTYHLTKSARTNQDTYYNQSPLVKVGQKVSERAFLSDGPSIDGGELALGKNILVAFMPWEGYNYEDAILMSENLLKKDTYTSIHIEQFEIEVRETKLGREQITRDIPNISEDDYKELDDDGIITVGSFVKPGGILVGKVTPKSHTEITPEYRLLYSIFGEKARDVKDSSLRVPHGTGGVVISVRRFKRENRDDLRPGVIEKVQIHLAKKRKLREGDKFAGRHGNKGVVARIIPQEDMPFMPDGTPVEVVLNPLGVPSRMNIGQVMETIFGYVGYKKDVRFASSVFNGISYDEIKEFLNGVSQRDDGKTALYDGRTGERFLKPVTVGVMYYLKLAHLADDKIHARSTGPYSLVTQQPLGGKAQFGGQRVGEMEVWAIEAYGAANVLQEFLTVKSDAIEGRTRIYESIVKGEYVSTPGIPESFNVLVQELRGLGLNIEMFDRDDLQVNIIPKRKKENTRVI